MVDTSKRKNDEKARGLLLCAALIILIGTVLLVAIAGAIVPQPYIPVSDLPTDELLYGAENQIYQVDFQKGVRAADIFPLEAIDWRDKSPDGRWEIRFEPIDVTAYSMILEDLTGQASLRVFGTFYNIDYEVSWSRDQQWVAFTAFDPQANRSTDEREAEIWMIHIPTGDIKRLTNNAYVDRSPSFSPDGTQLAYTSMMDGNRRVYIMDIATGKSRLLISDQISDNPRWSPDGQWIAYEAFTRTDPNAIDLPRINIYVRRIDGTQMQQVDFGKLELLHLIDWKD